MSDIVSELAACRSLASDDLLRRMPRPDLHRLVARCMGLAERCERDPADFATLHAAVRVDGIGLTGRRYVEFDTDAYLLVCRHVFDHDRSRGWRYAAVMREAAKRQIGSGDLASWLAENGGMNALFLVRPLTRTTVSAKVIRLTKQIEMPKHGPIVLTLQREPDGLFAPLSVASPSTPPREHGRGER